jgi:proline iminopeptidase
LGDDPAGGRPFAGSVVSAARRAADAAGDDVAWFCWNLGRRLYSIESALPFQMMPGDIGPRDPDVAALSRWIGSLMTLSRSTCSTCSTRSCRNGTQQPPVGVTMFVEINGARLNVEVLGPEGAPVLIAHHGGGGIGSLAEPKSTFGPLADKFRVVVFDARGCGLSVGVPPYSHAQWAADVEGLREWIGAEQIVVAGGSYGGFIAMEYAIAYPGRVRAMILRDTAPDRRNLAVARENARNQTRVEVNWENFDRYWSGNIRDDADLKACWAELIPLYDFEYDPVAAAERVEAGIYRHEAHNWCFQHNAPAYDIKPDLPAVTCPALVTVGRADWITPVSSSETIASLLPNAKLVVFEKSGHSPQFEEAELFQQTMREFLGEVLP